MKQRARKAEDKEARARAILENALALCAEHSFQGFTVADVAKRAGLAKGTVFLYYPTKESLGLALAEVELGAWFTELDARLGQLSAPLTPLELTRLLVASVEARPLLVHLLTLLGAMLEHNVDLATAARFKTRVLHWLTASGAHLERLLPFLPTGGGMRLLVQANALVIGLQHQAAPSPVVAEALQAQSLAPLRIDFPTELAFGLRCMLEGMQAVGRTPGDDSLPPRG